MHHREKFETVKISMLFDENNSTIIIQIIDSLILLISSIFAIAKVEFQFEFQSINHSISFSLDYSLKMFALLSQIG